MVLANPKQMTLFDAYYQIGDLQIYTVLLATSCLWGRFALYGKINSDLLISYLVIFFSVFVMLIKPGPGWYVWACPFLSVFFVKQSSSGNTVKYVYGILSFAYLTYFLFFNQFDYTSLSFLGHPVLTQTQSPVIRNVAFSILEAVVLGVVYLVYKEGVKSNLIYKRISNFVIGIGGDSGAGKTTILTQIKMFLGSNLLELGATLGIEGDADHKWERGHENWQTYTHLDPKANHLHSQSDSLLALKHGNRVIRREYDHCTGKFTESFYVKPAPYIVLCGLHPFYLPKMRKLLDLKIFLDTEVRLRRLWKIRRDRNERGHSISKIVQQCESRQLDSERYIVPQKQFADIVIRYFARNDFDPADPGASPEVCLRLTLDAGIQMDNLIEALEGASEELIWDYSDDLRTQWLEFQSPVNRSLVKEMSQNLIRNMDELVLPNAEWAAGYGAIVQLVILMALSEKKKARDEQEQI